MRFALTLNCTVCNRSFVKKNYSKLAARWYVEDTKNISHLVYSQSILMFLSHCQDATMTLLIFKVSTQVCCWPTQMRCKITFTLNYNLREYQRIRWRRYSVEKQQHNVNHIKKRLKNVIENKTFLFLFFKRALVGAFHTYDIHTPLHTTHTQTRTHTL